MSVNEKREEKRREVKRRRRKVKKRKTTTKVQLAQFNCKVVLSREGKNKEERDETYPLGTPALSLIIFTAETVPNRAKSDSRSHSFVSVVIPPTNILFGTVVPYRGAFNGALDPPVVKRAGG